MPKPKRTNPFYILLLIAGAAFAITAMAYGVMTVRELQASRMGGFDLPNAPNAAPLPGSDNDTFGKIVDRYGSTIMIVELVALTIGTFGAIGYDQHLDKKEQEQNGSDNTPSIDDLPPAI